MSLLLLFGGGSGPGRPAPPELVRRIRVFASSAERLTKILTTDISTRIALSETVTGIASQYFVNGVRLVIGPAVVEAQYVLAPATAPNEGTFFVVDTSVLDGADVLAAF